MTTNNEAVGLLKRIRELTAQRDAAVATRQETDRQLARADERLGQALGRVRVLEDRVRDLEGRLRSDLEEMDKLNARIRALLFGRGR